MYLKALLPRYMNKQTKATTMKRLLLSCLVAATAIGCQAVDGSTLKVKMDCKNVGDTIMVIGHNPKAQKPDAFVGKQGVFSFEVPLSQVGNLILAEPGAFRGDHSAAVFRIPGVPGEEAVLTAADGSRYDVTGSTFYAQYHEADLAIEEAQKEKKDETETILDFIKAHPDYEASAAIILMLGDYDAMKQATDLLAPAVRDGRFKTVCEHALSQAEARKKADEESAKKQAAGIKAPNFTLNDLDGKPLSLESLRGKYVILDFWGSWCVWCIKGIPQMKEYYTKYQGKFEILGIDCNDTDEKWRDAVKKHELPWLHVYNPRESSVLKDYGIQGFPTKIIVGPDGKIVKTIVGEDPQFYTLLDELFK